jgi:hypothetical protein
MQNCNKKITITLFVCLIITILYVIIVWLYDKIINFLDRKVYDHFYTKRNIRMKIYKSDEIFDPDEAPEYDDFDPDDEPMKFDPDQQPMLYDEEIKTN